MDWDISEINEEIKLSFVLRVSFTRLGDIMGSIIGMSPWKFVEFEGKEIFLRG